MKLRPTLALVVLCLASCGAPETDPGQATPALPQRTGSAAAGATTAPTGGQPPAAGEPGAAPGRTQAPEAPAPPAVGPNDDGELGSSAYEYLNRAIPRLVVEIDAVGGVEPYGDTLELVAERLQQVSDKPGGITVLPVEAIPGSPDNTWTIADLRASERRNRDRHSTAKEMVLYLQFVDGSSDRDNALAVAYSASAAAVFGENIRATATVLVGPAAVERAAVVHEIGHILSLVNLGYTSPRDHEDPDHPKHSTNRDSVMFWAVDTEGVLTILGGRTAPPTAFDREDLADLADVRSGRLR